MKDFQPHILSTRFFDSLPLHDFVENVNGYDFYKDKYTVSQYVYENINNKQGEQIFYAEYDLENKTYKVFTRDNLGQYSIPHSEGTFN